MYSYPSLQLDIDRQQRIPDPLRHVSTDVHGAHKVLDEGGKAVLENGRTNVAHQVQLEGDVVDGEDAGCHCLLSYDVVKVGSGVGLARRTVAGLVDGSRVLGELLALQRQLARADQGTAEALQGKGMVT